MPHINIFNGIYFFSDSRNMNSTITNFVQSLCPKAALVEHVGTDLTFHLPKDPKELTVPFDQFFRQLDQSLDHLKINTYGLSDTSLEEVLKLSYHLNLNLNCYKLVFLLS